MTIRPPRSWNALTALCLTVAVAACTSDRTPIGGNCVFNGDCDDNLVCAAGYCRQQCSSDRDCAQGFSCVPGNVPSLRVCAGPASPPLCTANTDCNLGDGSAAVCTGQRLCSPACTTSSDCASFATGSSCTPGVGCTVVFSDAGTPGDGGSTDDSGTTDAGTTDTGSTGDGATPDGATPDGATSDGATPDGATPDGATLDGSNPDGATLDASGDGSTTDTGSTGDGGTSPDGATTDGATDGGTIPGDGGTLRLTIASGDGQSAAAGTPLGAVILRLANGAGAPAGGVLVTVVVPDGASATPMMGTTNVGGEFTVSLRLGLRPGPYTFTASAPGADSVTISATATGPAVGTISSIVNVDHSTSAYMGVPGSGTLSRLRDATALALAPDNTLYISNETDCRILALSGGGQISSIAGDGTCAYRGDGMLATAARLAAPRGIALDTFGRRLFFSERASSDRVRVVDLATGVIDTVAGGGTAAAPGYGDSGPSRAATLSNPGQIALGPDGLLYVVDTSHDRIRRIDLATNTISGWVGAGACGSALTLQYCRSENCAVAWDAAGRAFVSGTFCGGAFGTSGRPAVARLDGTTFTVVAGGGSGTAEGVLATNATLPTGHTGLAFDPGGNLLISLETQHRVRRVEANGRIRTIAGTGSAGATGDGAAATSALLNSPRGIVLDSQRNLYVADSTNGSVRVVWGAGSATPLGATLSVNGSPTRAATLTDIAAVPLFGARLVDSAGANLAAWNVDWEGVDPGVGIYESAPTDGSGVSEVAVRAGLAAGTYRFRATATDIHGQAVAGSPAEFNVTATNPAAGTIFSPINTAHASGALSGVPGPGTLARLSHPVGLAASADGTLYVSDQDGCRVFALSPAGHLTRIAGTGTCSTAGDGGPAIDAQLRGPRGIALDDVTHRLYVAEYNPGRIRVIDLVAGTIDTFAGGGSATSPGYGDGGPARSAALSYIERITLGPDGHLYVTDIGNNRIRRINLATRIISNWFTNNTTCSGTPVVYSFGSGGMVAFGPDGTPYISGYICGTGIISGGGVLRGTAGVAGSPGALTRYAGGGPTTGTGEGIAASAAYYPVQSINIFVSPAGDLYLTVDGQNRVRRVAASTGLIQTVAGTGTAGESGDYGPATAALLRDPRATTFDRNGHLIIADNDNGAVRMVW